MKLDKQWIKKYLTNETDIIEFSLRLVTLGDCTSHTHYADVLDEFQNKSTIPRLVMIS